MCFIKASFIILSLILIASGHAQISGPVAEIDPHLKTESKNESAPILESGWAKDEDNDEVLVLDGRIRQKLQDTQKTKATTIYDNEKVSDVVQNLVEEKVVKTEEFLVYTAEEGDTLQKISQKIYGTTKRWKEIQLLNEEQLPNENIKKGMKLRFRPKKD